VSLEKRTDSLEEVGLSLAESKALLAAIQHRSSSSRPKPG
jgi:hypothetical protein